MTGKVFVKESFVCVRHKTLFCIARSNFLKRLSNIRTFTLSALILCSNITPVGKIKTLIPV